MDLHKTDPEFMERFEHFAFDEVINEENQQLDDVTRYMAILATLIGCQGTDAYKAILPKALDSGVSPIAVKEIVYQAVDYLGYGRMLTFLNITNEVMKNCSIELPLEGQATTNFENRLERGIETQAEIFGEHMKETWKAGHVNRWLAANCFGDYYTRTGLNLAQREMSQAVLIMNTTMKVQGILSWYHQLWITGKPMIPYLSAIRSGGVLRHGL